MYSNSGSDEDRDLYSDEDEKVPDDDTSIEKERNANKIFMVKRFLNNLKKQKKEEI